MHLEAISSGRTHPECAEGPESVEPLSRSCHRGDQTPRASGQDLGSAPGLCPCLQDVRALSKQQKLQKSQRGAPGAKQAWGILGLTNNGCFSGKRRLDQLCSWQSCRKAVSMLGSTGNWGGLREEPRKCLKDWKPAYCEKLWDLGVFSLTKRGLRRDFMESRNR